MIENLPSKLAASAGTLLARDGGIIVHPRGVCRRAPNRHGRRSSTGFTLLELMVVVVLIGVLVTLGIPSISRLMRDRRANQAAHEISLLYRHARSLAMGRGTAVLVRFDATSRGSVEVLEAHSTVDTVCVGTPSTSCNASNWDEAATFKIASFDPSTSGLYANVELTFLDSASNTQGDICFSPLGRPYFRKDLGGKNNFVPLTEVPQIQVKPVDADGNIIGLIRTVLVLPTGASRLAL